MGRYRINALGLLRWTACFIGASLIPTGSVRSQEATVRDVGGMALRVDPGLEIESVAGAELIKWPIVADWDSEGRLVVIECGGVAKPIVEHNKQLLHRIVRLVDTNGDGKFDKRIVAADKLAFPEGVLCIGNSLLVCAPPQIWKLTDKDGDGVCEDREVWFDPGTITGCANDLHGPYLGRDGWIYWCKGAFAEQHHTLISGKDLVTRAAHIFRRRFEGGPIEPVMTGGMDNPVEMAMIHTGERFFTSTFLQYPAAGKRDGIAHAVYGGVYGKPHDVLSGHKRTGDLMPIMTHLGPAAPSGLICLESTRLLGPSQGTDTLVAAQFNLHKVTAHTLMPQGAGFVTEDRELVSSERIDFHPTDIIEAPDGSLLVIDTGGWYNLCCPSSGVNQAIALGGIYRLTSNTTRQERAPSKPKRWDDLNSQQAAQIVGDQQQPLRDRQAALWRLCRINSAEAQAELIKALNSSEPSLRQIAAHAISVQRVADVAAPLQEALSRETEPQVKRALAEAIGRLGSADSIPVLLHALESAGDDRYLEHSLIYALIELDHPERLLARSSSDAVNRAELIAIDQPGRSDLLNPPDILAVLTSEDASLRKCAADIAAAHPEWAAKYSEALQAVWSRSLSNAELRDSASQVLAAWSGAPEIIEAIGRRLSEASRSSSADQQALIETLGGIHNKPIPHAWLDGLLALLKKSEGDAREGIVAWLASMTPEPADAAALREAILSLSAKQESPAAKFRLLSALPAGSQLPDRALEQLLVAGFLGEQDSRGEPSADATADAARALQRVKLSRDGAEQLIAGLDRAQPLQLLQA
ncbi:MAG: PVC-type heme-binding CxxCH protein, partial [Aureliella sp.]